MLHRAEQKLQTRNAPMDAARSLMDSGRGFGSLSLREVARDAGVEEVFTAAVGWMTLFIHHGSRRTVRQTEAARL